MPNASSAPGPGEHRATRVESSGRARISVALCTYDGARFLGAQLESFATQIRLPDELVVCDDHSSDGTAAVLRDFARRAPFPVRILTLVFLNCFNRSASCM